MSQFGGEIKMQLDGLNPEFSFQNGGGESILQSNIGGSQPQQQPRSRNEDFKSLNRFDANRKPKGSGSLNNLNNKIFTPVNSPNSASAVVLNEIAPEAGTSTLLESSKNDMDSRRNWMQNRNKASSTEAMKKQKSIASIGKTSISDVQFVPESENVIESPLATSFHSKEQQSDGNKEVDGGYLNTSASKSIFRVANFPLPAKMSMSAKSSQKSIDSGNFGVNNAVRRTVSDENIPFPPFPEIHSHISIDRLVDQAKVRARYNP